MDGRIGRGAGDFIVTTSSTIWVPYGTADNPLNWPDLPEWDSIFIAGMVLPIEGLPQYTRELGLDKKHGKGQDYYSIASQGIKPSEIHITLKLWIDFKTGKNYLDMYRLLIPKILPSQLNKRFAVPIYHPVLEPFGVSSAVFDKVPTPQHVGGHIFHVQLEAIDGRAQIAGSSKTEKKAPATGQNGKPTAITAATQVGFSAFNVTSGPFGTVVTGVGGQSIGISTQDGFSVAQSLQSQVNTPASQSTAP